MMGLMIRLLRRILPDWAEGRRIYVFLGRESWLVYEPGEGWFIKTARCNFCGKCCEVDENWPLGTKEIDDKIYCQHINKSGDEWFCEAGSIAPFNCAKDKPLKLAHPDCSIRYERLE